MMNNKNDTSNRATSGKQMAMHPAGLGFNFYTPFRIDFICDSLPRLSFGEPRISRLRPPWHPVLTAAVGVPLSYLLARASWVLIENPFLKLKSAFEYQTGYRKVTAPPELAASSIAPK